MDSATEKLWKDLEHHHASSMQMYLKTVEALNIFQVLLCGYKAWQNTYSLSYNITLRYCDLPGWTVWNSTKSPSGHLESLHSVDSPFETGKVWAKCLNAKRLAELLFHLQRTTKSRPTRCSYRDIFSQSWGDLGSSNNDVAGFCMANWCNKGLVTRTNHRTIKALTCKVHSMSSSWR